MTVKERILERLKESETFCMNMSLSCGTEDNRLAWITLQNAYSGAAKIVEQEFAKEGEE